MPESAIVASTQVSALVREPAAVMRDRSGVQVTVYGDDKGSLWAYQHRQVVQTETLMGDGKDRKAARVNRAIDGLEEMHRNRTISAGQFKAGRRFQNSFDTGHLEQLRAANLLRETSVGGLRDEPPRIREAADTVFEALKALGGINSLNGRVAWAFLGERRSLRDTAVQATWGRTTPLRPEMCRGVVCGILETLAAHWGYDSSGKKVRDDPTPALPMHWIIVHRYETGFIPRDEALKAADQIEDGRLRQLVLDSIQVIDKRRGLQ